MVYVCVKPFKYENHMKRVSYVKDMKQLCVFFFNIFHIRDIQIFLL
jgi:hypothetical protein